MKIFRPLIAYGRPQVPEAPLARIENRRVDGEFRDREHETPAGGVSSALPACDPITTPKSEEALNHGVN